jgi:hypothetical protein
MKEESQEDKDYQQGVEDGKNGKDFDIFTATPDYALGHEVGSTQRKKYGDFDKERFELE